MIKLPYLTPTERTVSTVSAFGGLNRGSRIGAGELSDMKNLTSDAYPILASRPKRGRVSGISEGTLVSSNLLAGDRLCYTYDRYFVSNALPAGSADAGMTSVYDMGLSADPDTRLVAMGSYVLIFPDKKYINLTDPSDRGDIEYDATVEGCVLEPCDSAGAAYENITVSAAAPDSPESGDLWLDTGSEPAVERVWSESDGAWTALPATYVRLTLGSAITGLSAYDGITLAFPGSEEDERIAGVPRSAVISSMNGSAIVFPGQVVGRVTAVTVRVSRKMPETDLVFECGNRLWGCRYGESADGTPVNEIYASKLGDFKNWNCFEGISTDSYAVSLGAEGAFTGGVAYLGIPTFFREGYIHKIYGDRPSQFTVQSTACSGVALGCADSIAEADGTLYYRSRCAVCAYDGSLPTPVSAPLLPDGGCASAVGGALGSKYYLSMKDKSGRCTLYVYDSARALWHIEDDTEVSSFASVQGELFFIDAADRSVIRTARGGGVTDDEQIRWYAVSGVIGEDSPCKKYISELMIRMKLAPGGRVRVCAEYDSSGVWEQLASLTANSMRSFTLPVRPRRADHLRIRIEGEGDGQIFSVSRVTEKGSEL